MCDHVYLYKVELSSCNRDSQSQKYLLPSPLQTPELICLMLKLRSDYVAFGQKNIKRHTPIAQGIKSKGLSFASKGDHNFPTADIESLSLLLWGTLCSQEMGSLAVAPPTKPS